MESESRDRTDLDGDEGPSPRSRPYVHEGCGQVTVVSGDDFSQLANPFSFVLRTYCVSCKAMVGLRKVAWADTGERISAYRRRLRSAAPASLKLFGWVIGPLGGAALGAGIGWLFTGQPAGAVAGGVVGLFLTALFLMPVLARWIWGIDYRAVE